MGCPSLVKEIDGLPVGQSILSYIGDFGGLNQNLQG